MSRSGFSPGGSKAKRVLLLAFFFPPRVTTGSLRATYLAKYLPGFDWRVTVVTAKTKTGAPPEWAEVIETNYEDIVQRVKRYVGIRPEVSANSLGSTSKMGSRMTIKQRFVEQAYRLLTFPDPYAGWLKPGLQAVRQLLASEKYDALLSTSYPYTAHLIASRALAKRAIPWVADLRDAWRGNHYEISPISSLLNSLLERKTLKRSTAITTVSTPLAQLIHANNPAIPTIAIPNAFDPEEWRDVPYTRPSKFTLTYAGSLLQGFRDPEPLLDALIDEFQASGIERERVEIVLYVRREKWLEEAIIRRGLGDVVTLKGYVDRAEVLKAERATSVNVLLLRDHPDESGVYTGKLFEYLGAGLPIIAIGGPEQSVVRDLLDRVGGSYVRTLPEIRMALRKLYLLWDGGADLKLDGTLTKEFSAVRMARRFADVLEAAISKQSVTTDQLSV